MAVRRLLLTGLVMMALTWLFEARAETAREAFWVGDLSFAPKDIADARAQPEPDGTASILITLEADAAAQLNQVRAANKGKQLPLMLGARVLAVPIIDDTSESDILLIAGAFSNTDAKAIALAISGKPPLPESLDEAE